MAPLHRELNPDGSIALELNRIFMSEIEIL